jgi:hypothetical protein
VSYRHDAERSSSISPAQQSHESEQAESSTADRENPRLLKRGAATVIGSPCQGTFVNGNDQRLLRVADDMDWSSVSLRCDEQAASSSVS